MGFRDLFAGLRGQSTPAPLKIKADKGAVYAPVAGKVETTASLPDPIFASSVMGPCIAIKPADDVIYSPVDGTPNTVMPHAFAFEGDDGVEVLVHVGIDTVEMRGEGFKILVKAGQHIAAGTPILVFDRKKVAEAGYSDVVMTIVTNVDELSSVDEVAASGEEVEAGSKLFQTA